MREAVSCLRDDSPSSISMLNKPQFSNSDTEYESKYTYTMMMMMMMMMTHIR